jgi:hypothetical protein
MKSPRKINLLPSATSGNTDAKYQKTRINKYFFILYAFVQGNMVTTFDAERSFSYATLPWTVFRLPARHQLQTTKPITGPNVITV